MSAGRGLAGNFEMDTDSLRQIDVHIEHIESLMYSLDLRSLTGCWFVMDVTTPSVATHLICLLGRALITTLIAGLKVGLQKG